MVITHAKAQPHPHIGVTGKRKDEKDDCDEDEYELEDPYGGIDEDPKDSPAYQTHPLSHCNQIQQSQQQPQVQQTKPVQQHQQHQQYQRQQIQQQQQQPERFPETRQQSDTISTSTGTGRGKPSSLSQRRRAAAASPAVSTANSGSEARGGGQGGGQGGGPKRHIPVLSIETTTLSKPSSTLYHSPTQGQATMKRVPQGQGHQVDSPHRLQPRPETGTASYTPGLTHNNASNANAQGNMAGVGLTRRGFGADPSSPSSFARSPITPAVAAASSPMMSSFPMYPWADQSPAQNLNQGYFSQESQSQVGAQVPQSHTHSPSGYFLSDHSSFGGRFSAQPPTPTYTSDAHHSTHFHTAYDRYLPNNHSAGSYGIPFFMMSSTSPLYLHGILHGRRSPGSTGEGTAAVGGLESPRSLGALRFGPPDLIRAGSPLSPYLPSHTNTESTDTSGRADSPAPAPTPSPALAPRVDPSRRSDSPPLIRPSQAQPQGETRTEPTTHTHTGTKTATRAQSIVQPRPQVSRTMSESETKSRQQQEEEKGRSQKVIPEMTAPAPRRQMTTPLPLRPPGGPEYVSPEQESRSEFESVVTPSGQVIAEQLPLPSPVPSPLRSTTDVGSRMPFWAQYKQRNGENDSSSTLDPSSASSSTRAARKKESSLAISSLNGLRFPFPLQIDQNYQQEPPQPETAVDVESAPQPTRSDISISSHESTNSSADAAIRLLTPSVSSDRLHEENYDVIRVVGISSSPSMDDVHGLATQLQESTLKPKQAEKLLIRSTGSLSIDSQEGEGRRERERERGHGETMDLREIRRRTSTIAPLDSISMSSPRPAKTATLEEPPLSTSSPPTSLLTPPLTSISSPGMEATARARRSCQHCGESLRGKRFVQQENGIKLCEVCFKEMFLPKVRAAAPSSFCLSFTYISSEVALVTRFRWGRQVMILFASLTVSPTSLVHPQCRRCHLTIEGRAISSGNGLMSGKLHPACFVCWDCSLPFDQGDPDSFYIWESKPCCRTCYHVHNGTVCASASCHLPIEGPCVSTVSGKYHRNHLTCDFDRDCAGSMMDYYQVGESMICQEHVDEALKRAEGSTRAEKRQTKLLLC